MHFGSKNVTNFERGSGRLSIVTTLAASDPGAADEDDDDDNDGVDENENDDDDVEVEEEEEDDLVLGAAEDERGEKDEGEEEGRDEVEEEEANVDNKTISSSRAIKVGLSGSTVAICCRVSGGNRSE